MSRNGPSSLCSLALTYPDQTAATAGAFTGNCRVGNQPAATLLIPYFEVDSPIPGAPPLSFGK